MTIVVRDHEWEQSQTHIYLKIPMKGISPKKVDVFSTEKYFKMNFSPFIFECFFLNEVIDRKAVLKFDSGYASVDFAKSQPDMWNQLECVTQNEKERKQTLREEAIEIERERLQQEREDTARKIREKNKEAISSQLELEKEERNAIELLKQNERDKATISIEEWNNDLQNCTAPSPSDANSGAIRPKPVSSDCEIWPKQLDGREKLAKNMLKVEQQASQKKKQKSKIDELNLRKPGNVQVQFSPRVFPTAARDSTREMEDEWLRKQAEARRIVNLSDSDLTAEEKNPVWLQTKGKEFFRQGNYQAALNAFSQAIGLNSKLPSLFSNRSACQLKVNNLIKCIEDSSKALELLTPPVVQNAAARCRAHVRRGTAFYGLELFAEALVEYEAALRIAPADDLLRRDLVMVKAVVEGRN